MTRYRLAIVASHPIQYQAPWFRALTRATDLDVFFCHRQDASDQANAGFDGPFEWDVPLLDGYRYHWLENRARRPNVFSYRGCDTPGIDQAIAGGRFGACIVSGWYLKSYVQAIRACRRHRVAVFLRGDSHLGTPRSPVRSAVKWLPYRLLLSRVDGHLSVGQANRAYLRHYGVPEPKLFFVPHFVDNDFFAQGAECARKDGTAGAIRQRLGIPDPAMVALFVGRFVPKKRPGDFVAAIAAAATRSAVPIVGLMVGSGPLMAQTEALARRLDAPVRFAGFRNQAELPACYASADVLVLPSDGAETWGLVVNEAMACGIPAVVSEAAGCAPDLIVEGRTGYTFPLGDTAALADRLAEVGARLAADAVGVRRGVEAHISTYSCARAVEATLAALEQVAGAQRRLLRRL